MPYVSELGTGQLVYLDNQNNQTIFTILSSSPGQQQQATNSFTTGPWTAPPQILQNSANVLLKIFTANGEQIIQIQGNQTSLMTNAKVLSMREIDTMPKINIPPMQPMQPMGGMSMKMGNMEMNMGTNNSTTSKRFCPSCGAKVNQGDRFCSSCGYNLV